MFDAYNLKKILPRMVVAVILIQLSWYIFTGAIWLTSAVSYGIEGLMYAPFGGRQAVTFSGLVGGSPGGAGMFTIALLAGAAATFLLGSILALALMALLGLFLGFVVLLLRQIILVVLLILSPLALVAWILPGTQKFWKMWWDNFIKLLLMFPMIIVMLAGGRIVAYVAASMSGARNDGNLDVGQPLGDLFGGSMAGDLVFLAIVTVGYFGPFFLIPKTFQAAGTAFGFAAGAIASNGLTKGARGYLGKRSQEKGAERREKAKAGELGKSIPGVRRLSRPIQYAATPSALLPGRLGNKGRGKLATIMTSGMNEGAKELQRAGLLDDTAGNEFIQHGHSTSSLNRRIKELQSQGNHALASQLTQYAPYAGQRDKLLGAMQLNASFGKLADGSLKQLDTIYGNSQADNAAKQSAFGNLIFTSKNAGNYATYAARIEGDEKQGYRVKTMSDTDYHDTAMDNMSKALMDAGPQVLSSIKPYTDRTDGNGYNTKTITAQAMARSAINAPGADGRRPLSVHEHARAMEAFVSAEMEGAYNDPNMKAAFDEAMSQIQSNPEALQFYNDARESLIGRRRGMAEEEFLRGGGGSAGGPPDLGAE